MQIVTGGRKGRLGKKKSNRKNYFWITYIKALLWVFLKKNTLNKSMKIQ